MARAIDMGRIDLGNYGSANSARSLPRVERQSINPDVPRSAVGLVNGLLFSAVIWMVIGLAAFLIF